MSDHVYMRCYDMGGYTADGSELVTPLIAISAYWTIKPYQKVEAGMKENLLEGLKQEWSVLTDPLIQREWPGSTDVFYVLIDVIAQEAIGCVAVDRKKFQPFISNLFVISRERGKGWSDVLLQHAEHCIREVLKFREARLWCVPEMVNFYEKKGWTVEKKEDTKCVMIHRL